MNKPIRLSTLLSFLVLISCPALSTEEIIVTGSSGGSGPDYYITGNDWVRDMNYQQLLQHQANERQRRYQEQTRYENERSLARCEAQARDDEHLCAYKANIARTKNMAQCAKLAHGLDASITRAGGFSMGFSASDSYSHCENMTQMYHATDISGCKAIASAEINRCQQEH